MDILNYKLTIKINVLNVIQNVLNATKHLV